MRQALGLVLGRGLRQVLPEGSLGQHHRAKAGQERPWALETVSKAMEQLACPGGCLGTVSGYSSVSLVAKGFLQVWTDVCPVAVSCSTVLAGARSVPERETVCVCGGGRLRACPGAVWLGSVLGSWPLGLEDLGWWLVWGQGRHPVPALCHPCRDSQPRVCDGLQVPSSWWRGECGLSPAAHLWWGERPLPARAECVDPSGQDQGWDRGTVPGRGRSHGRLLTLVLEYPWSQVPVRATGSCSAGEGPETPRAALRQPQDKHDEGRGCRAQALRGGRHGGLSGGR